MPEQLATEDGATIAVDDSERAFHRAMAAPEPDEPMAAEPPKRAPADPEAPFGRTVRGEPKKAPGGRPPKPRVIDGKPAPAPIAGKPAPVLPDFTEGLSGLATAVWMVAVTVPVPSDGLRVKLRAEAHVISQNHDGIVRGVNIMAQHNETIRRGVSALTTGGAAWVLPACLALAPFAVQSAAVLRSAPSEGLELMAARAEAEWAREFRKMRAEMGIEPGPGDGAEVQADDGAGVAA